MYSRAPTPSCESVFRKRHLPLIKWCPKGLCFLRSFMDFPPQIISVFFPRFAYLFPFPPDPVPVLPVLADGMILPGPAATLLLLKISAVLSLPEGLSVFRRSSFQTQDPSGSAHARFRSDFFYPPYPSRICLESGTVISGVHLPLQPFSLNKFLTYNPPRLDSLVDRVVPILFLIGAVFSNNPCSALP